MTQIKNAIKQRFRNSIKYRPKQRQLILHFLSFGSLSVSKSISDSNSNVPKLNESSGKATRTNISPQNRYQSDCNTPLCNAPSRYEVRNIAQNTKKKKRTRKLCFLSFGSMSVSTSISVSVSISNASVMPVLIDSSSFKFWSVVPNNSSSFFFIF